MRIDSVRVREFGTIGALDVDFDDELTVITGPNEAGKSTLMRAIWFALTRRAQSQAQEIRDVEPHTGGTPEVRVTLRANGAAYDLRKTFAGPSGTTTLQVNESGKRRSYEGDEADEVLREALGFGSASGRSRTPEHFGFWPAIWVDQEESGADPGRRLSNEGNPDSISGILAQIGGRALAGADGGDVVQKAKARYDTFFTASGSETKRSGAPLHEARQQLETAESRLQDLETTRDAFEQDLADYERKETEIERVDARLPGLREDHQVAKKTLEEVQSVRKELETKEATLKTAEQRVSQIEERVDRREELRGKIEALQDERDRAKKTVEAKRDALETHKEARPDLADARDAAERERDAAKRRVDRLQAHLNVLQHREKRDDVQTTLDKLDDLSEEHEALTRELAGLSVEEEDVDRLESLKSNHEKAHTRLQAAAAHLRLTALDDVDVAVSGESLSLVEGDDVERRVDEPTIIEVASLLRIELEPGGEDLASIREQARTAEGELDDALSDLRVDSVAEARRMLRRRDQIEATRDGLKRQMGDRAPDGRDALETKRAEAEEQEKTAREQRDALTEPDDNPLTDDAETAREQFRERKGELEDAKRALEQASENLQAHDKRTNQLQSDEQVAVQKVQNAEENLQSAERELEAHRDERGTDEELRRQIQAAEADAEAKANAVDRLREKLDDLPDDAEEEKERAKDALEHVEEERRQLQREIDNLSGRLERADLRGLHERLEEARHEHTVAQSEVDRLQKQAEAAKLLYETLVECRDEARQQYLAPLQDEAEDLLDQFFGAEEIHLEFGEAFDIARLNRSSDGSFSLGQLSTGAREQLSVLVRLAMARLMAREQPHPVFLDDALADTDVERFKVIARILRKAAREMQIVMLTCHRDRYRDLGVPTHDITTLMRNASA